MMVFYTNKYDINKYLTGRGHRNVTQMTGSQKKHQTQITHTIFAANVALYW